MRRLCELLDQMVQMDGRQRMVGERGWRVQASESKAQSDTIGEYPGTSPCWGVSRLSGVTCRWKRRFVTETLRKRRVATRLKFSSEISPFSLGSKSSQLYSHECSKLPRAYKIVTKEHPSLLQLASKSMRHERFLVLFAFSASKASFAFCFFSFSASRIASWCASSLRPSLLRAI